MTPREIHDRLAQDAEGLCRTLLPNGKRVGNEWKVGGVTGEDGDSMGVRLTGAKAGIWCDFAGGKGGDMIDLVRGVHGSTLREALVWCRKYAGIQEARYEVEPKRRVAKPVAKPESSSNTPEVIAWFKERGISSATLDKYRVVSKGTVAAFPCYAGDDVMHIKYRDTAKPKKEAFSTSKDSVPVLFGWQAIAEDAREVIIAEGECDALAYAEQGLPALSVPMGAGIGGNQSWIDQDWERLERFDEIYISADMDDAGKALAEHLAVRLGRHRCRVVTMPEKDANDAILNGRDLSQFLESAKHLDPKEIRAASSYLDEVRKAFYPTDEAAAGFSLPWHKTQNQFRLRPGEVTIWAGYNGAGKSMVLSHIAVSICAQGGRIAIASMEMSPPSLLRRMFQQIGAVETPSDEYLQNINAWIDGKAWIIAVRGTAKTVQLLELCEYCWRRFGVEQIIIDSLAKCGIAEDDYNGQKAFVDQLSDFAAKSGCHIHLVCHSRKLENESGVPGKMDVKGTGAITDMVDNVVAVWRNKPKEDAVFKTEQSGNPVDAATAAKPDCMLQVHKQRNWDWEHKIALWFSKETHQYLAAPDHQPRGYIETKYKGNYP